MITRELAKAWRDAVWNGPPDADAFVAAVPALDAADIPALFDVGKLDAAQLRVRAATLVRLVERSPNKAYFLPLVRGLKTAASPLREAAMQAMVSSNDVDAHAELCELLRSSEQKVRQAASEVLRKLGGKTALKMMIDMVQDQTCPGRMEGLDALMPMAGHHAMSALVSVAQNGKPAERVHALKYLGDPRFMAKAMSAAVKAIAPAVKDANEMVASQAILSLGTIASEEDYFEVAGIALESSKGAQARAAIEGLKRFRSPRTIAALRGRMQIGPTRLRFAVLQTLEAIGSVEVLPLLVDSLAHRVVQVRQAASETLMRLAQSGKVDLARTVLFLLRSKDVSVRRSAAELARGVKDPQGDFWRRVVAALRDEDWWVRERVMDALLETAGWQIAGHVVGFLRDGSAPLRRFAIDVLAKINRPESIPPILQVAQSDTDWWVRERAIEVIGNFGDERAVPYLIPLLSDAEVRIAACDALGKLKAASAGPQVLPLLRDADPDVRTAAMRFLDAVDLRSPELQHLTHDPVSEVARKAHALLVKWEAPADIVADSLTRLDGLLVGMVDADFDDLIVEAGLRPHAKRLGTVKAVSETKFTAEDVTALITSILNPEQLHALEKMQDLDFSYKLPGQRGLRFRVNVFRHREGLGAVFRKIRQELPALDSLGLPEAVQALADLPHGLVLVGGPTGSGKSTTLAALIAHINATYARHIITIEDPIEAVHGRKKGLVNQREVGPHAKSFERALRATLREDPDVILVGEMRDAETIRFAIAAADTGHLVFATVHTTSSDTAVDRLVGSFPPGEQQQIRSSLSTSLRAIVCQMLLPRLDGNGRTLALEILLNNDAISNLIRKAKAYQIPSVISTSREMGMRLMDHDLARLAKEKTISVEDALFKARSRKDVEQMLGIAQPAPQVVPKPGAAKERAG